MQIKAVFIHLAFLLVAINSHPGHHHEVVDKVETQEEIEQIVNRQEDPIIESTTEEGIKTDPIEELSEEEKLNNQIEVQFYTDWSEKMSDFEPSYVYMFPIEKRNIQIFYENITKNNVLVRGAFLITEESDKQPVEVMIMDPAQNIIYKNNTIAAVFSFDAVHQGEYSIRFRNLSPKDSVVVTFTMNTYQQELLSSEHLSFSDEKLNGIMKFMSGIRAEEDFSRQFMRKKKNSK